jgi:protein-disulfide isomerase
LQGQFVPFHDALFHLPGAPTPQAIESTAAGLGLDVARLRRDMESQAVRDRLKQDVELAARLKIVLTPSMFLNGRQINSALAIHLGTLCNELLKSR